jgi:hypothetical protein
LRNSPTIGVTNVSSWPHDSRSRKGGEHGILC